VEGRSDGRNPSVQNCGIERLHEKGYGNEPG
jgi:hypothetical protein